GHHRDGAAEIAALLRWRVQQQISDDRRAAEMGNALALDRREDRAGLDAPETHMSAGERGDGPRKEPAIAMEHRQGPEIDRVPRQAPHHEIADRVEISAAVMIDDAFGIAGGARGV